ncbi:hypothetical protein POJ06DRAFT_139012 [Lipomyces tetrasporus]|uniref:Uncharacterized protein n=1 Tax=Lipomyces tetrasporus TaxID=54092 RepID=A0AAD7VQ93_9ASCO|nr:uncharacterized protein POJ06DRAFT_139012 [Lipomyces tetrasporus]KAJ8098677.1 hypothetical protein POJ06DRAFT_139012 [Lipomyces tetrasporus]
MPANVGSRSTYLLTAVRTCLGQRNALTEAGYTIVRLLQRFDALKSNEPLKRMMLTMCPSQGVRFVRFH